MQSQKGANRGRNLSRWSLLFSIPLAAAFLYWSVRGVEWSRVWQALTQAQVSYLAACAVLMTFGLFVRALRWRVLLNAEASLDVGTVFRANMVGYLGNNFLPGRAGELRRSVWISRESPLTNTYVLTTALSERMMDVIAVVLAAALSLLAINPKPVWLAKFSGTMLVLAGFGALAVVILPRSESLLERLLWRLPMPERIRRFVRGTAEQVLLGLRAFHNAGRLAAFAILTVVIWTTDGVTVLLGARSLHLTIPFPAAMLLLTAMALGSALPSTPGYLGIYQVAAVLVLGTFGVARDAALAYSFIAQALSFVVIAAIGVPCALAGRRAQVPQPEF